MSRKRVDFHADDYGMFREQSKRILRCKDEGVLTGISILANGPELEDSLGMLPEGGLDYTVHLNLLGGHCVAPIEKVSLLVDENGIFNTGFLKLLLSPLTGKGRLYREQIREEYRAQITRVMPLFENAGQPLRVDGHAHWHVLPVCYDAIMDLISEGMDIRYIRLPSEPFSLYLKNIGKIFPIPPINIVKSVVLKCLTARDIIRRREMSSRLEKKVFLGVMLSGCFEYRKMKALLPGAVSLARDKGIGLEILAHPGAVYEAEDIARITNEDDRAFLTSLNRNREADGFVRLRKK